VKKIYGLFSAWALAAFAVPFLASAQTTGKPLDLMNRTTRMVSVQLQMQVLMGRSQIVEMGFAPSVSGMFTSDGTKATIQVRGSSSGIPAPEFAPVQAGPAMATIAGARLMNIGDLTVTIDIATGATRVNQMAMGSANVTARLGGATVLNNRPVNFGFVTRSANDLGPLFIATINAANPAGGQQVSIDGAACAKAGSGFLQQAMMFGLSDCDSRIRIGNMMVDQFSNEVQVDPAPFNTMTGIVKTVGTQVITLAPVLGIQIPEAVRFNRVNTTLQLTETN
jgi:hypothetical protein